MHRKTAHVIKVEIESLAREFGLQNLGFVTFTFREKVYSIKEANRRFKSLVTNVLVKRYQRGVVALERHQDGAIHYHLVVVVGKDIQTGLNWSEIMDEALPKHIRYRSANEALKAEWKFWRDEDRGGEGTAKAYGFGRVETLPIRTTAEGIANYVGSYIGKHIQNRRPEDKGARLIRFFGYDKTDRHCSRNFSWNSPRATLWRAKLRGVASEMGMTSTRDFAEKYGSRWAYKLKDVIVGHDLLAATGTYIYPSAAIARADGQEVPEEAGEGPVSVTRHRSGGGGRKYEFNADFLWDPTRERKASSLDKPKSEPMDHRKTEWAKFIESEEGQMLGAQCQLQRRRNSYAEIRRKIRGFEPQTKKLTYQNNNLNGGIHSDQSASGWPIHSANGGSFGGEKPDADMGLGGSGEAWSATVSGCSLDCFG